MVLFALVLAACRPVPVETMNEEEAKERARGYAEDAVAALPEGAKAELSEDDVGAICDDEHVQLESYAQDFSIAEVSEGGGGKGLARIAEYWEGQGYSLLEDARPEEEIVRFENEADGFILVIGVDADDELTLTINTPCIWRNGEPPE